MTTLSQGVSTSGRLFIDDGYGAPTAEPEVNVARQERMASLIGGGFLTLFGVRRRSTFGMLVAAAGIALVRRGATGHCPAYAALGKNTATPHDEPADPHAFHERGVHVEASCTVNKPADELYRFWKNVENLPRFMTHLHSVEAIDDTRSHWVANGPLGFKVAWDAEVINDEPNETIAWRSIGDADVHNAGSVRFLPADSGTLVKVVLEYLPPAGEIGRHVAKLFGEEPSQQVNDDLQRFKQIMEA